MRYVLQKNGDALRDSITRRPILVVLFVVGVSSTIGCSPTERNHIETVSLGGKPVLTITCQYVGKTPGDPTTYQNSHDYRSIDTDFYRITMDNLTDVDIVIKRVDYRMRKGPTLGSQTASAESIKRTWGTNIVAAKSSISRANNLVWSKSGRNALLKTYHFEFETASGNTQTFSAEVPLVYNR
jgi:hypothetical protein